LGFCKESFLAPEASAYQAPSNHKTGHENEQTERLTLKQLPLKAEDSHGCNVEATEMKPVKPTKSKKSTDKFEFVEIGSACNAEQSAMLSSVQELWTAVGFGGKCKDFMGRNNELKLVLLTQKSLPDDSLECSVNAVVGFLAYRINREKKYMSIRRLAIMPQFQRQGHGRRFVQWCMQRPGVSFLSVTSVERSVGFYQALGFKKAATWHAGGKVCPDDDVELNQEYMEYYPRSCKGGKSKKR